jgi:hypothetical protein
MVSSRIFVAEPNLEVIRVFSIYCSNCGMFHNYTFTKFDKAYCYRCHQPLEIVQVKEGTK